MIRFDTKELAALEADLTRMNARLVPVVTAVLAEGASDLERSWRDNARETSGTHGRHYPNSIDHQRLVSSDIAFEVGPNPSKPQGGMSFEFGSVNQPAHLDGQRAADELIPRIDRRVSVSLSDLGL